MPTLHLAILALVQGITEFLPVSSSGHLVLVPLVADWPDQGLLIDVAVHVGTLGAVVLYTHRHVWAVMRGTWRLATGRPTAESKLLGLLVLATVPVVGAGYALHVHYPQGIRSIEIIGWATLGFGCLLYLADKIGMTFRRIEHLGFVDAIVMGLAQCLALIPGTSRAGITMTAGRILGMERPDAARFSMLMSIPAIAGAGSLAGYDLYKAGDMALTLDAVLAAAMAFVAALIAIALMMAWIQRSTFTPFVIYRIVLGAAILAYVYEIPIIP